ncbi:MAG: hypothetical protein H8D22_12885, partial [Candidatus Cloacimonetes bacterium]|nr:hypothetical protein [Candidatus Cloacimonadota bacterium]
LDFPELILPDSFIKLIKNGVMVNNEVWDARTRDYIFRNPTEEAYHIGARDKILFAATTLLSNVDIAIQGYFTITLPVSADISTDIAIPDTWEEAFTAGVIAYLTLDKSYRDEEIHKVNQSIFDRMLVAIRTQEKERFTASSVDQEYNYSNPEGK